MVRTLKTPRGARRLWVTPEASLRYWLPNSLNNDRPLCQFAGRYLRPGQRIWDVGANIGVFTFLASAAVGYGGRVLAIEADPFISQLLIKSSRRLPVGDAIPDIVTSAISDSVTLADFGVPNRSRASNHLLSSPGCTQTGGVRFSFKVPCVTLEWLWEHSFSPDLIKMDIEGIEYIALASSQRLLREVRPALHLEVWSEIAEKVGALLAAHSYLMFDGETDIELSQPLQIPTWCTIAVPAEKRLSFAATVRNGHV